MKTARSVVVVHAVASSVEAVTTNSVDGLNAWEDITQALSAHNSRSTTAGIGPDSATCARA
jgi:hypothetical protein